MKKSKGNNDDDEDEDVPPLIAEPVDNDVNWKGGFVMWCCSCALNSKHDCVFAMCKHCHKSKIHQMTSAEETKKVKEMYVGTKVDDECNHHWDNLKEEILNTYLARKRYKPFKWKAPVHCVGCGFRL